jgi:hypothetical protein
MSKSLQNQKQYYDKHWQQRGGHLQHDEPMEEKIRLIHEMIPPDVKTIIDIGCGDGAITNTFAEEFLYI